jgi:shikimate kinase
MASRVDNQSNAIVLYHQQRDPQEHLERTQQAFMEKSFKAQISDHHYFYRKGEIVVLTGIVSAGKSSITGAIQTIDPQFCEEDLDLRRDPEMTTTREMEYEMMDDTINRSLAGGKTVISLFDPDRLKRRAAAKGINDLPIKTVLLHCPFSEIPDRLETRNQAAKFPMGDPKNYREPIAPLDQYALLYGPSQNPVETIDRTQAIDAYNSSFDKTVAHAKERGDRLSSDDEIARDKEQSRDAHLQQLGFNASQTEISVAPTKAYDLVIDTSSCRDTASRVEAVKQLFIS